MRRSDPRSWFASEEQLRNALNFLGVKLGLHTRDAVRPMPWSTQNLVPSFPDSAATDAGAPFTNHNVTPPKKLTATIVIATFNRLPNLRRLLAALGHLDDDDFEVVIVNGPSNDGTAEYLAEMDRPMKILQSPHANVCRSRNLGMAQATGDIVAFLDDDALPVHASWLNAYRQFFEEDEDGKCSAVGGPVIGPYDGHYQFYEGLTSEYAEQSPQGVAFRPASRGRVLRGVMGCNCAVRAAAFREVGGFDERMMHYLDETDLCFRLAERGYTTRFFDDNPVLHFYADNKYRRSRVRRHWSVIFRSDTYFCLKHARDFLPVKIWKILRGLGSKHFFELLFHPHLRPRLSYSEVVKYSFWSLVGVAEGFYHGLFSQRCLWAEASSPPARVRFQAPRPRRKLRIGLIIRTLPGMGRYGGPGQFADALAKGLYELGHEVHLFCVAEQSVISFGVDFHLHPIPLHAEDPTFYDRTLPSVSRRFGAATAYCRSIEKLADRGEVLDFMVGCNWDLESLGVICADLCPVGLFLVTTLAKLMQLEMFPKTADNFLWNSLDRWQAVHAPVAFLASRGVLDGYTELLGIREEDLRHTVFIPLGVERTFLPPISRTGQRPRVLFVGRLERRKGIHTLLAALPGVLPDFPDWECHIVGDDSPIFENGQTIRDLFLCENAGKPWLDRVAFHGFCSADSLHRHYRECEILAVPALYESFGLAYHEAMQYGKPVIACRAGGIPETLRDGQEGLLITPENVAELENALRVLMSDQQLREKMGRAGAERIRSENNHLTAAREMERVILDYLESSESPTEPLELRSV
ncbi:MAG: hypothetical protein QOD99_2167 [Chthoniobacter sp.]|jgi:glycosyltransferase involved in cell wall biosynthesis/GT2 family glycosyltransferase|nr:hypothetical protein [Chthoniobacter sp.]